MNFPKNCMRIVLGLAFAMLLGLPALAQNKPAASPSDEAREKTAQESLEKCKATATVKTTPQMLMEKTDAAVKLIEKDGPAAFDKFRGKDSEFIFAGTYITVSGLDDAIQMVHPIKWKLEGKSVAQLKDKNGKLFTMEMIDKVKKDGKGWVEYAWPKPGETAPSSKVTYVAKASNGDKNYFVACGSYDFTLEEAEKAPKK